MIEGVRPEWLPAVFGALVHPIEIGEETISIMFLSRELRRLMKGSRKPHSGSALQTGPVAMHAAFLTRTFG
jgi:hypothetical protein